MAKKAIKKTATQKMDRNTYGAVIKRPLWPA